MSQLEALGFKETEFEGMEKQVLDALLNSEHNLEEKTDIKNPINWAIINQTSRFAEDKGLTETSKFIDKFMNYTYRISLSNKRLSRKELVDVAKTLKGGLGINEETQKNIENKLGL